LSRRNSGYFHTAEFSSSFNHIAAGAESLYDTQDRPGKENACLCVLANQKEGLGTISLLPGGHLSREEAFFVVPFGRIV